MKQSGPIMPTISHSPMSPLLEDSVKDGVPSVHVGVEPSTDAGGVQARPLEWLDECPAPLELPDSTLNDDLFSARDSILMSVILMRKNWFNDLQSLLIFKFKPYELHRLYKQENVIWNYQWKLSEYTVWKLSDG